MRKIAFLISLMILTSCHTTPVVKFVNVKLPIPVHKTLPKLTPQQLRELDPSSRKKLEKMKAILIGNIYQLEEIIRENNKRSKQ